MPNAACGGIEQGAVARSARSLAAQSLAHLGGLDHATERPLRQISRARILRRAREVVHANPKTSVGNAMTLCMSSVLN